MPPNPTCARSHIYQKTREGCGCFWGLRGSSGGTFQENSGKIAGKFFPNRDMLQILGFRAPGKANLPGTLGPHCRDLVTTFRAGCFFKSTVPAFSTFSEFGGFRRKISENCGLQTLSGSTCRSVWLSISLSLSLSPSLSDPHSLTLVLSSHSLSLSSSVSRYLSPNPIPLSLSIYLSSSVSRYLSPTRSPLSLSLFFSFSLMPVIVL